MAIQIVDTTRVFKKETKPAALETLYAYRRPQEVKEFLAAHPFLESLLAEAYNKIGDYFEPQPTVALEVVTDPEVHGVVKLFGYIVTPLTADDAGRRLQQFDRGWFLQQLPQAKGLLNFDVEFQ